MIGKLFGNFGTQKREQRKAELYRALIRREAKIGGELFGPIPDGRSREFFVLDRHTIIWHEEWNENGKRQIKTTRYDVRPDAIIKVQDGQNYQRVSAPEAKRLQQALHLYRQRVFTELYPAV